MNKINVLSLFDGMSCGQIALNRVGIEYENYFASEIDKYAIQVTQKNYPNIIQIGDVTKWRDWNIDWSSIDLVTGGFPCQAWSLAGKQLGDKDERGKLFWVMLDIISNVLKHNPNAKFLMENVKMKKEFEEYITFHTEQALGKVNKHLINSSLVSAQNRNRYYWTNIDGIEQPNDKGLVLKDILEDNVDKSHYISDSKYKFIERNGVIIKNGKKSPCLSASFWKQNKQEFTGLIQVGTAEDIKGYDSIKRIYSQEGKCPTLTTCGGGHTQPKVALEFSTSNGITNIKKGTSGSSWFMEQQTYSIHSQKTRTLKAGGGSGNIPKVSLNEEKMLYRKLTPIECERLQTVDDNYTSFGIDDKGKDVKISNTQRYKMLGNGWTVDVIAHIFKNLPYAKKKENEDSNKRS